MLKKNCSAILLGAGKGIRVGYGENKIFINLKGKTLLQRAVENILKFPPICIAIFVIHPKDKEKIQKILQSFWKWEIPFKIITGGNYRWQSSIAGVTYCQKKQQSSYFFLHDLARPFVSLEQMKKLYNACLKNKVSAPYLPLKDTIRKKKEKYPLPREELFATQTPQFFDGSLAHLFQNSITNKQVSDDIFFAEQANIPITWVLGEEQNFKITTTFDLEFAKFLIETQND